MHGLRYRLGDLESLGDAPLLAGACRGLVCGDRGGGRQGGVSFMFYGVILRDVLTAAVGQGGSFAPNRAARLGLA
jgi:hypothetical protein